VHFARFYRCPVTYCSLGPSIYRYPVKASHAIVRPTAPFSQRSVCCEWQADCVVLPYGYKLCGYLNALNQRTDRKFRKIDGAWVTRVKWRTRQMSHAPLHVVVCSIKPCFCSIFSWSLASLLAELCNAVHSCNRHGCSLLSVCYLVDISFGISFPHVCAGG
jgi:hypothetical protein